MRILIMESGSFKTIGGAAKDTYHLFKYLRRNLHGAQADLYADFSKFTGEKLGYVARKELFKRKYDAILMNSIRDSSVAGEYIRATGIRPFTLYTDRGDIMTSYSKSPAKRLASFYARIPPFSSNAELFERKAHSMQSSNSAQLKRLRNFLSKSYALNLFRSMRSWLDCYVATTPLQAELAGAFFAGTGVKVEYLPRAPHAQFRRLGARKSFHGGLFVGRLEESQKNVSFMIRGIAEVLKARPDLSKSELLRIAGEGPDSAVYASLVHKLGLERNVKFLGFNGDDHLPGIYNNAGFFVATSNWESPGRAIIEAMACGIPILMRDRINSPIRTKPLRMLVEDGKSGFIYRDMKDFVPKFIRMYEDRRRSEAMGRYASRYVGRELSLERLYRSYMELIISASKSNQRAR